MSDVFNRIQCLVIGFYLAAWISVIAILLWAPAVYDRELNLSPGDPLPAEFVFLAAISALIGLLAIGAYRRWRWVFWLTLVASLAGIVRVPVTVLELTDTVHTADPTWYSVLQGVVGVVQFAIGLVMVAAYRKAGAWGPG